ncbi:hypothetical protein NUU61_004852 [Penicillium alfredii]|uniref:Zn(2)-C6 fungal-type domain-containing protein n=1 Tax=Penicillium alfredii TaxID=1506179 RepID=A0A9W9F8D0_9EURO|nr:uncharacterized protein NUU61_004852 [Penicillium alfredii]KAJ5095496.1 hypothetical protein NUU61_004852 [Penicillium alfredii]
MLPESNGSPYPGGDAPKLRTACENCRQSKVKCNIPGKSVCTRCLRHGLQCQYGFANRSGKPKGSKNRATLRKLGQLQEDKPTMRGFHGCRLVAPVLDLEPVVAVGYAGHRRDPKIEDDVCLIPGQPGLWESPRILDSVATLETSVCSGQLPALDGSPFIDRADSCAVLPAGIGYPHTPVTPSFLSADILVDGMTSPSLAGSVASPYTLVPCECVELQLLHMNRLSQLLAEALPFQFDHSLQTIKAAFNVCQMFVHCGQCAKDSANLLLAISVLNLILQLFEYWVSQATSDASRPEHSVDLHYGSYEMCHDENRRIRNFLVRGLLLQCREVLSGLKGVVHTAGFEMPKFVNGEGGVTESAAPQDPSSQPWASPRRHLGMPDMDASESSCLLPIVTGYEATVEAFLRSFSAEDCICRTGVRDEIR